jgi:hypothetical protein
MRLPHSARGPHIPEGSAPCAPAPADPESGKTLRLPIHYHTTVRAPESDCAPAACRPAASMPPVGWPPLQMHARRCSWLQMRVVGNHQSENHGSALWSRLSHPIGPTSTAAHCLRDTPDYLRRTVQATSRTLLCAEERLGSHKIACDTLQHRLHGVVDECGQHTPDGMSWPCMAGGGATLAQKAGLLPVAVPGNAPYHVLGDVRPPTPGTTASHNHVLCVYMRALQALTSPVRTASIAIVHCTACAYLFVHVLPSHPVRLRCIEEWDGRLGGCLLTAHLPPYGSIDAALIYLPEKGLKGLSQLRCDSTARPRWLAPATYAVKAASLNSLCASVLPTLVPLRGLFDSLKEAGKPCWFGARQPFVCHDRHPLLPMGAQPATQHTLPGLQFPHDRYWQAGIRLLVAALVDRHIQGSPARVGGLGASLGRKAAMHEPGPPWHHARPARYL